MDSVPILLLSFHPSIALNKDCLVTGIEAMVVTLSEHEVRLNECVVGAAFLGDIVRAPRKRARSGAPQCTKVLFDAARRSRHLAAQRAQLTDNPSTWVAVRGGMLVATPPPLTLVCSGSGH